MGQADTALKQRIREMAVEYGFADIRFVSPRPFDIWERDAGERGAGLTCNPLGIMPEAGCIAVMLRPYAPGSGHYSRYYISSNEGHGQTIALASALSAQGCNTLPNPAIPHRAAALRSGGILGVNNLYMHPEYGSRLSIHLLLVEGCPPDDDGNVQPCLGCGECICECPGGALPGFDRERCIRYYMGGHLMPEKLRGGVSGILGCDICQNCCPHNTGIQPVENEAEQEAFRLDRLLAGDIADARNLVGSNYGRSKRLACQAVLLAAAQDKIEYLPLIRSLTDDDYPQLAEYAVYAVGVLSGKG